MSKEPKKPVEISFPELLAASEALEVIMERPEAELAPDELLGRNLASAIKTLRELCLKTDNKILAKVANPGKHFEARRDFYYMAWSWQDEIISHGTQKKDLFKNFAESYPQHADSIPKSASHRSEWLKDVELEGLGQKRGSPWRP